MEFSKRFFKFLLVFLLPLLTLPFAHAADAQSCLEDGKFLFSSQQYAQAQQQFATCLKTYPNDEALRLSLAGTLYQRNQFAEAEKQFQTALAQMDENSPYRSYVYSMLGDLSLKQQKDTEALERYNQALAANKANVNALIGKGVILEYTGSKKEAAAAYEDALSFEPTNLVARKRLINLEPFYFTDEQILTALLQRHVIKPGETQITDEQRDLFFHIHQAEQRRGPDYLKNKVQPLPPDYIITLYKDSPLERQILTYSGYQSVQKNMAKDAVAAFESKGVPAKDIFSLRDTKGKPVFDKNGYLTDEGFYAYTHTLAGKKAFLLPHEDVPPSAEDLQRTERAAKRLKEKGYIEISRSEYNMLLDVTQCSQETLQNELDVRSVPVTKHRLRYFVQSKELPQEEALKAVPYYYVMTERAKKNRSIKVPKNSVVEYHKYFGHAEICLEDGKPLLQKE